MSRPEDPGRVNRYFAIPCAALQPYVDRLWGWESDALLQLPALLPGTGAELLFHYGRPFAIESRRRGVTHLGPAQLLCARTQPQQPLAQAAVGFVAVRFRSGALRHFSPLPLADLRDDVLSIGDVWGQGGRDIAERVLQAGSRNERIALLEDWLLHCLHRYHTSQPAIEAALRQLYYRHREVRIDELADQLGMSRRHFERLFREQIGVTPKAFQRTARFNLTVRDLLLSARTDYLATALDHGYYDQAHFIHEVRSFVGESPATFLQTTRRVAHFYNPPIFAPDKVPSAR
jgi:AraC-like DNA-binding protein